MIENRSVWGVALTILKITLDLSINYLKRVSAVVCVGLAIKNPNNITFLKGDRNDVDTCLEYREQVGVVCCTGGSKNPIRQKHEILKTG